jgi:hypothetical protein
MLILSQFSLREGAKFLGSRLDPPFSGQTAAHHLTIISFNFEK